MECSALFVVASLRGVKAGAILAVNAAPEPLCERILGKDIIVDTEMSEEITKKIVDKMIEVALEATTILL